MKTKKTVLLYGGSFNPIHQSGHIQVVKNAFAILNTGQGKIDEVWLLPALQNPVKSSGDMVHYQVRFQMCEIAAADYSSWLKVSNFEATFDGDHYTYEVLKRLIKHYHDCQFIWLMGSDNLQTFHEWEHWEDILQMVSIVVVDRECSVESSLSSTMAKKYSSDKKSLTSDFANLPNWRMLDIGQLSGRATNIRKAIMEGADTPDLCKGVRAYIDEHNLYR